MKKIVLMCLLAALIAGSVFAQFNTQPNAPANPPAATPTTTIKGTLGLSNGRIAVVSGNITYYVRGLERFVGFIDGLKEGAQVTLEGYAAPARVEGQKERLFHPVKLTLNGKTYEVGSADFGNMTRGNMWQNRNGRGAGPQGGPCCGYGRGWQGGPGKDRGGNRGGPRR
jgi:hypothetical protein